MCARGPADDEPTVASELWLEARPFVSAILDDVRDKTPYSTTDLGFTLKRLARWALVSVLLDLDRRTLLRRDVIDRFIVFGCPELSVGVRGNMRSQLLRIAEVLLDPTLAQTRLTALSRANPSVPYTSGEITKMLSWASGQHTPGRRADARILIHLGLGAGLSASEIGIVESSDVSSVNAVLIHVRGDRERVVPVLAEWEAGVRERAAELPPHTFLFRPKHVSHYPNLLSNFISKGQASPDAPQTQRMRATWIVTHLSAGTPIVPVMRAAGVDSLEALTRYVRFVREPDPDGAVQALRLSRSTINAASRD